MRKQPKGQKTPIIDSNNSQNDTSLPEPQPGVSNQSLWSQPKKRKTSKADAKNSSPRQEDISMQNSFESLGDERSEETSNEPTAKDKNTKVNSREGRRPTTRKPEDQRPPPIHTMGKKLKEIADILTKEDKEVIEKFTLSEPYESNFVVIFSKDMNSYKKFKEILDAEEVKYYTYTPKGDKPKSIVMKGLYGDFNDKDVENDLKSRKLNNVEILKVNRIVFNKRTNNFAYLIQVSNTSNLTEITNVKSMLYQKVRWEQLRRDNTFQSRNCQRLGHAASTCTLPMRCVKCAETHGRDECKVDKKAGRAALKCANCEKQGHPANYRGCIFFKGAKGLTNVQDRENNQDGRDVAGNAKKLVRPNVTYARVVRNNDYQNERTDTVREIYNEPEPQIIQVQNNVSNEQTTPAWAEKLQESMNAISNKFDGVEKQVQTNTMNIQNLQKALEKLNKQDEQDK